MKFCADLSIDRLEIRISHPTVAVTARTSGVDGLVLELTQVLRERTVRVARRPDDLLLGFVDAWRKSAAAVGVTEE
jgi:hypothetical protein